MRAAHKASVMPAQRAVEAFKQAFELERDALVTWEQDTAGGEPTRSVLCRSAAALALRAGMLDRTEELLERAESENAPPWLAAEVAELRRALRFARSARAARRQAWDLAHSLLRDPESKRYEVGEVVYKDAARRRRHRRRQARLVDLGLAVDNAHLIATAVSQLVFKPERSPGEHKTPSLPGFGTDKATVRVDTNGILERLNFAHQLSELEGVDK